MTRLVTERRNAEARPGAHPEIKRGRVGVLLVNLGTPDAPTARAVRRFLAEFLADRRVVDFPRLLWLPILYGVILNLRPAATARNYAKIWRADGDESPLRFYTRAQAQGVAQAFGEDTVIDWAMRYGTPSIAERMIMLQQQGCDRILVLPLYPQYSATTTASVADAAAGALETMRRRPALRVAPAFYGAPAYIDAVAGVVRRRLEAIDWAPERVVLSFHGLPQRSIDAGDPYARHCAETARLLRAEMGWTEEFAPLAFQSRFGPGKWLGPATAETIAALAGAGVMRLAVIAPGFVSDCIETLEEIGIGAREAFHKAGGELFELIPCLNDSAEMQRLLETLIRGEAADWIEGPPQEESRVR